MSVLHKKQPRFNKTEKQQLTEAFSQLQKQLDFAPAIKQQLESLKGDLTEPFRIYQQKFSEHWIELLQESSSTPLRLFASNLEEIRKKCRNQILEIVPMPQFSVSDSLYNSRIGPSVRFLGLDADAAEHPYHENKFGIFERPDGGFEYKGRLLLHLSIDSKHGYFFAKSLKSPFNFVSDKFCADKLQARDYRHVGYVIRDLRV